MRVAHKSVRSRSFFVKVAYDSLPSVAYGFATGVALSRYPAKRAICRTSSLPSNAGAENLVAREPEKRRGAGPMTFNTHRRRSSWLDADEMGKTVIYDVVPS
jgi:hypothetical protein